MGLSNTDQDHQAAGGATEYAEAQQPVETVANPLVGSGPWQKCLDAESGCAYFYNQTTGETTWEDPTAVEALPAPTPTPAYDASADKPLPPGWARLVADCGSPYYHNATTGETTWVLPTNAPGQGQGQPRGKARTLGGGGGGRRPHGGRFKAVGRQAQAATMSTLPVTRELAAAAAGKPSDEKPLSMEEDAIARRRRNRTNRGSVAGRELGKSLGRSRLLWLKSNWLLVALILVALLGLATMLVLLLWPCAQNIVAVENQVVVTIRTDRTLMTQVCSAKDPAGQAVDIGFKCPGHLFFKETCNTDDEYGECVVGCRDPATSDVVPADPITGLCPVSGQKPACLQNCTDIVCTSYREEPSGSDECKACAGNVECVTAKCAFKGLCAKQTGKCLQDNVRTCVKTNYCNNTQDDPTGKMEDLTCKKAKTCIDPFGDTKNNKIMSSDAACPTVPVCYYCENIDGDLMDVGANNTCPTGAMTPTAVMRPPESNGKCRALVAQADFDGQLMLDFSGSLAPGWQGNNGNNYFTTQCDVAAEVVDSFNSGLGSNSKASFRMGAFTWSMDVTKDINAAMTSNIWQVKSQILAARTTTPTGGTHYANPIAKCAFEVKRGAGASQKNGAYKMCFLLTDGENSRESDTAVCTTASCKRFCSSEGIQTCSLQNIVAKVKELDIKLVGAYIERGSTNANANRNLFCYSSCNTAQTVSDCKANMNANAQSTKIAMAKCDFFIAGNFKQKQQLKDDLDIIVRKIVATVGQSTSDLPPATVTEDVEETTIASSVEATPLQAPAFNQSTSATDGVITEGCNDPVHLWPLLLFLPLILYLLYYPYKRHKDRRKRRLRMLLLFKYRQAEAERKAAIAAAHAAHAEAEARAALQEEEAAASAQDSKKQKKKKYKWDIESSNQYLWSSSTGGGVMRVNFGGALPPSAPKKDAESAKVLKTADGRVLRGEDVEKAVAEMQTMDETLREADEKSAEAKENARLEREQKLNEELELAERLEQAGELGDDGAFWVRCCPCCETVLEDGYEEELARHEEAVRAAAAGGEAARNDERV